MDPLTYPTVTLNGETYPLRFSVRAVKLLKQDHAIDLFEMQIKKGLASVEQALTILAAAINHDGVELSVEDLESMVDLRDIPMISAAISEALGKASTQATASIPAPPPAIQ